jgi:hypothetical protein
MLLFILLLVGTIKWCRLLLKYTLKEKICNEIDNLIKRTTTYLNTFCKLREPRRLLINLYNTRKQVL